MNRRFLLSTIFLGLIILFTGCSKTVDLSKYAEIRTEGYDGKGKAYVSIDFEKLEEDYGDSAKFTGNLRDTTLLKAMYGNDGAIDYFESCLKYSLDNSSDLKNGDSVTIKWDISDDELKYVNLKVKETPVEIKVKNLKEIEFFDPFVYIDVVFSGTSPDGTAQINNVITDDLSYRMHFECDKTSGLKNGDKCIVTCTLIYSEDETVSKFGKLPGEKQKEYTVSGLPEYLTCASEVDEAAFNKMDAQARDIITGLGVGKEDDVEYIGNYWLNNKGIYSGYGAVNNCIYLVYKITDRDELTDVVTGEVSSHEGISYFYVRYDNLKIIDGSVWVDATKYSSSKDKYYVVETDVKASTGWFGSNHKLHYFGYKTLDEIYKIAIVDNIEHYSYEENINEQ